MITKTLPREIHLTSECKNIKSGVSREFPKTGLVDITIVSYDYKNFPAEALFDRRTALITFENGLVAVLTIYPKLREEFFPTMAEARKWIKENGYVVVNATPEESGTLKHYKPTPLLSKK